MRRAITRALMSGMMGSSVPAKMSAGCFNVQSQGRLVQPCHRHDLIEVSAAARSAHGFGVGFDELRVLAEGAAVNLRSDSAHETLVDVPPRRRHLPQHPRTAGHHDRPRGRRRQHELSAHIVVLMGELLRDPAAPRHAADVGALMSKFRQKLRGQTRN